jgi:FLVCR family MFS transporter 7
MCFVLFGCISTIVVGIYLDRTKNYLLVLRSIPITSTLVFLLAMLVIPTNEFVPSMLIVTFGGICCVPIIAVCYQLGTECTHPVQPALVLGLMMSCAQITLFGMNFVFLSLLNDKPPHTSQPIKCLFVMDLFPFICIFLAFFVKADLRRLNAKKLSA